MKGFDSGYREKEQEEPTPRPGTIAYLRLMEKEKQRKAEEEANRGLVGGLGNRGEQSTLSPPAPPSYNKRSSSRRPSVKSQDSGQDTPLHQVEIVRNYVRFHVSVFRLLPNLREGEMRLYLYLIEQSYGSDPPRNYCEYSQRDAMTATLISSPTTVCKGMASLEERGLIAWTPKATRRGVTSRVRVFLPCEVGDKGQAGDVEKKLGEPD